MTKIQVRTTAVAAVMAVIVSPAASAAIAEDDPFAGLDAVARTELGDMRGGMMINGIPVNFAVVIRTTVEGALAANGLQTTLTVDDAGNLAGASSQAFGSQATVTDGGNGVTMTLAGGGTSILHQVLDGQIQALVSNSANDVSISHQTQVNVTMPGFNQLTQTYFAHTRTSSMGREAAFVGLGRF